MSKDEWKKLNKNEWKKWLAVVGRMLLAYALVFAQGAWATQNQETKDNSGSPQKAVAQQANEKQPSAAASAKAQNKQAQGEESEGAAAEQKPSHDGSHEGIKVHGHWTIEVRNRDGTLVTHREFENSLTQATGSPLLASLLNSGGNQLTQPFVWGVVLGGIACGSYTLPDSNIISLPGCVIAQPSPSQNASVYYAVPANSYQLAPSVTGGSFVLNGTLQFSGSASTVITSVATETIALVNQATPILGCVGVLAGTTCLPIPVNQFTSKPLDGLNGDPQAVSVSAGQTIAVTVKISFS